MRTLNYHHLRLFWAVAREGNLTRASRELHLAPQTVSSQIRDLEEQLGEKLFVREGRRLVLTDVGTITLRYANEVFAIGNELLETLRGQPSERALRLVVGVASVLPTPYRFPQGHQSGVGFHRFEFDGRRVKSG